MAHKIVDIIVNKPACTAHNSNYPIPNSTPDIIGKVVTLVWECEICEARSTTVYKVMGGDQREPDNFWARMSHEGPKAPPRRPPDPGRVVHNCR